ncbi:tabersonine 16-hydroxylase 2-like [Heracleum sosnowskyi]|uniref:Tabersonine 16-hydroxylase 2-like n=1 Tax=Heracleum sosnowskyi TaxID=360622 RepID=A0AAD8I918_9APIA|nr:tabersonine 16-hydroxylase 2-like [Heracleum sosnowskyi]
MENQISHLFTPFALFLFLFILLKFAKVFRNDKIKLPPGPRQLPFIGNIHQVVGSLPHHILKDLANKYGPLMSLKLGEVSVFVVSSSEVAHDMMKTHDLNFVQRPLSLSTNIISYNSSDIAFSPYGDYWRQMRRICTLEIFSSKSVQKFRFIREEEVLNFINLISRNKGLTINLSKELFSLTSGITARAAFGKKINDKEVFAMTLKEIMKLSSGFSVADMYPSIKFLHVISGVPSRLEKVHKEMDKILGRVINEHRDGRSDVDPQDLVDVLLKTQKDEYLDPPLMDNNIKAVISDIISAGKDVSSRNCNFIFTSSISGDWCMHY